MLLSMPSERHSIEVIDLRTSGLRLPEMKICYLMSTNSIFVIALALPTRDCHWHQISGSSTEEREPKTDISNDKLGDLLKIRATEKKRL